MLQVGIGVSANDDTVMMNVESHQLALRSIVLGVLSGYGEEDVAGIDGRSKVAVHLRDAINAKLEELENFGGTEEATSHHPRKGTEEGLPWFPPAFVR